MKLLEYTIQINATPEKVWEVLFTQDNYKKWASAMNEGTYFEGTWEEGTIMKFLDPKNNGMYNLVEKNIPNKQLSMKHLGWILEGELSPQDWEDSTLDYILEPNENGTLLIGKVNSLDEFVDFFNSKYPKNFENIKNLAEE
ncbi:Activator of Hsp90 ATPase homolog 1-like protein [Algoriella xinjiangensis]|uniref:Activator of Hsp90 ATPase homolog 1-like protein n=1 Tax=Algoriella xinjiangensis TaxID=684065 RepID=A0A1I4WNH9_9FLAO|nr:SRPBCC domain-containing protein [Algoriella xinjiangensis]SFN15424.1 Activator of Hsp90 ATPase homolog 1-like protein [Algoriella xinjiangensis]VDH16775.1 Activator of Hsp90 ATPase homolog 1-like protein [Algoriella xinjiangensis]